MSRYEFPRFKDELIPFETAIQKAWIDKCEPGLLPHVIKDHGAITAMRFPRPSRMPDPRQRLYVATAGGPCSGKSTILDNELAGLSDPRYSNIVIVDPDRYVMEYMNFTYRPLLSAGEKARLGAEEAAKVAYDRARPGSNIIANLMLNEAFASRHHIAHGTTMTGPFIGGLLSKLGAAGYERRLILCGMDDQNRIEAGRRRIMLEAHYQVDPSDFVEKGKLFPQRMADYFTHGDHVVLMWKETVDAPAVKAAEYKNGMRVIHDEAAFDAFTADYERRRVSLGATLQTWNALESIYGARFAQAPAGPAIHPLKPR